MLIRVQQVNRLLPALEALLDGTLGHDRNRQMERPVPPPQAARSQPVPNMPSPARNP
ncbi:hypothetical protein [Trichothermofontia sp.]